MSLPSRLVLLFISFYKAVISPFLGGGKCRYYPTCSEYAEESIKRYGFLCGVLLGLHRILRCGPWGGFGYDPVPEPEDVGIGIWIGRLFKRTSKG